MKEQHAVPKKVGSPFYELVSAVAGVLPIVLLF
jgi:hypothetical protein